LIFNGLCLDEVGLLGLACYSLLLVKTKGRVARNLAKRQSSPIASTSVLKHTMKDIKRDVRGREQSHGPKHGILQDEAIVLNSNIGALKEDGKADIP
jgi:hypothetical protein